MGGFISNFEKVSGQIEIKKDQTIIETKPLAFEFNIFSNGLLIILRGLQRSWRIYEIAMGAFFTLSFRFEFSSR
jgi:hypothetical protein